MTKATASPAADDARAKKNIILLFCTLMVTMLLASLSQMILSSALPTIVGELHGVEHLAWVITAYMLASTIMMPIYGKVSDLFGRKPILVGAIVIFIVGSVLGALAQDMNGMIIARTVQGLGGGGLMILSQAAIADVVPARERGRYSGIMGGVFAVSSVAGPLLGGWFTEGPGWRWTFWINIPLGVVAVVATVVLMRLPKKPKTERPRLDYLGMALLSLATAAVVLIGTWGGSTYDWNSPQIFGLLAGAVIAAILFAFVESRAAEPVMPLSLFKDRNFNLATLASLLTSVAMFGAIGYIPTYFQMAAGASATQAGLLMIPMMGALLITSVITGAVITRTGRYKFLPVAGSVVLALGLGLLATVTIDTPTLVTCGYMAVMGIGLGASMQILVLVVQNSFPHRIVGTATAANNYFRQVGGSLGSAIVGSVFATRLAELLAERLPQGSGSSDGLSSFTPAVIAALPDPIRLVIVRSYNEALIPIFVFMVPLALLTAVVLLFITEKPLATHVESPEPAVPPGDSRTVDGVVTRATASESSTPV
ncbi:MDR family MFS transporter, partial [Streptosporangium amethystogenes]|uniref:MDR family MFS transporter n=1 Tax=Streptosporangium amethystogenes TaxID=2002 RepID=UPI0004C78C50